MSGVEGDPTPLVVLVAEDEPLASMALRAQLEALDYQVLGPARNGDEAVALGACYPVDVALFDVRMPGRSGLEAAIDLFQLAPTPVVLLSGVANADLPDPLPRPPVFALITKPAGLDDIAGALDIARSRFQRWLDQDPANARSTLDRDQRATIGRATDRLADGQRSATAAARLLERARQEDRSPLAVARDILADNEA
jgi:two-component system, response regulator PdtaR